MVFIISEKGQICGCTSCVMYLSWFTLITRRQVRCVVTVSLLKTELAEYRKSAPRASWGYGSLKGTNIITGEPRSIPNISSPHIL